MKNLVKLIAIHMDENNKSLKLIDLFTSLHKLLLQIELNSVNDLPFGSKDSTASNIDSLPCALQIFATAHQYLLQNNRCLENGGEVLLHVFDLILKYQQNSISATDKVSNLLRQMANSLFGVTLEDIGRDYLPIDSTRQRQIFDIFRPVNLHVSSMTELVFFIQYMIILHDSLIAVNVICSPLQPTADNRTILHGDNDYHQGHTPIRARYFAQPTKYYQGIHLWGCEGLAGNRVEHHNNTLSGNI